MNNEWEDCLNRCNESIRHYNKVYKDGNTLLQDAVKSAFIWVPNYLSNRSVPTSEQLLELGTKLIAVGIATELDNKNKRIGF